jgi:hypothetical protein
MPPNSKELWEEGAVIKSFKVIEGGVFKDKELVDLLMAPAQTPGCQGTRCLQDNISDIKAQAAANHRGSQLIHSLIADYGLETVLLYSTYIVSFLVTYTECFDSGRNPTSSRASCAGYAENHLQDHGWQTPRGSGLHG